MNLELNKFKKVSADDKKTVLQHINGHTIHIAHKGLSEKHRKELEEMPIHQAVGGFAGKPPINTKSESHNRGYTKRPGHGGGPEGAGLSPTSAPSKPAGDAMFTEPSDIGTKQPYPKSVNGDYAQTVNQHEAQREGLGGIGTGKGSQKGQVYPPCINPSCKSYGRSHPNCRCYGGNEYSYERLAKGGEVKGFCSHGSRVHENECEYYASGGEASSNDEANLSDSEKLDMAKQEASSDVGNIPQEEPNMVHGEVPQTDSFQKTQPNIDQEMASADQAAGPVQPPASPVQQFVSNKNNIKQEMLNEAQSHQNDLNAGHITPETYHDLFAKQSTLGKISTIFGLLVGGAGAGLSHQPNMLMQMMDNEIQRDLDAQKQSAANKINFLNVNSHILKSGPYAGLNAADAQMAYNMGRMQMNNTALHSLVAQNNKLPEGSPQRKQGDAVLAMMNQAVQTENFNIADRASTAAAYYKQLFGDPNGGSGPNTTALKAGVFGPQGTELGQDIEQKSIPGVSGKAQRPVQQHDRDQVQAMNVLDNKAKDLLNFAEKHKGSLNPNVRAQGAQKAAELVNFYNSSIQGGVLTEGRLDWLDSQIGKNPTSVFQDILGNNAKLREIQNSNSMRKNMLLKSYGFPIANEQGSSKGGGSEMRRKAANGKIAVFDSKKNFLRYE